MSNTTNIRSFLPGRGLAVGLAAGVVLSVSFSTWAEHDPIDLATKTTFNDGEAIEAGPFNDMFDEIYAWASGTDAHIQEQDAQIADLTAQIADLTAYTDSLIASPCGETDPQDGAFGGYDQGKVLCGGANGCSPDAHLCTSDEILRHFNAGGDLMSLSNTAWVSGGVMSHSPTYGFVNDCSGWTATNYYGAVWNSNGQPSFSPCTDLRPLLCCD